MNLQQQERFYQFMNRVRRNSRAASSGKGETRVTEVLNGIICSKSKAAATTREPEIINLQEYARSANASVPVNKLQEIIRFQRSNGRH